MKTMKLNKFSRITGTDNRGFVMILALMVLLIVVVLGSLSLRISNTEVLTSGTLQGSVASFYMMESLGQLGVQKLVQQNINGDDCIEAEPEHCLVKELYYVDATTLPWLDEAWSGDTSKEVFNLRVFDPTIKEDLSVFPKVVKFPDNWIDGNQKVARVPDALQVGNGYSLEPAGYQDAEDGGKDFIRFAVQDHGRVGIYSIGAGDPILKEYRIYGLYYVDAGRSIGYSGKYGIELGYRLELASMEIL